MKNYKLKVLVLNAQAPFNNETKEILAKFISHTKNDGELRILELFIKHETKEIHRNGRTKEKETIQKRLRN